MAVSHYQGKKFCNNKVQPIVDALTVEEALQININNEPFTVTMRTPGNDVALVRGLLFSEDIYRQLNVPLDIIVDAENSQGILTKVNVNIPEELLCNGYMNSRNILSVSSCGICGKQELEEIINTEDRIEAKDTVPIELLYDMFTKMNKDQSTFKESGGSHAAGAFDINGDALSIMEDIGRHNAVDKVIGELLDNETLGKAKCMVVSGRISYEIVTKAFRAKIPTLAAVSAPSSLAVDYAKELGITLLGFCRKEKATCYAHPERITN